MGLRELFGRMFGGSGEQAYNRAEEERAFEPRVDIDAIRADEEAARFVGKGELADAERLSDPDAS
jgi:hypothetical protein